MAISKIVNSRCAAWSMMVVACLAITTAAVDSATVKNTPKNNKNNILFLFADEMDGRILDPKSPQVHPPLPHLNRLASSGAVFTTTYSQSPQCVPSRSAMMAGLRTDQIKVYDNFLGMISTNGDPTTPDPYCVKSYGNDVCVDHAKQQAAPPTFIDRLYDSGSYNVTLFGKMHVGGGLTRFPGSIQDFPFGHNGAKTFREWSRGLGPTTNVKGVQQDAATQVQVPDNVSKPAGGADYAAIEACVKSLQGGLFNNPDQAQFLYCSILVPHPPYKSNQTYMSQVANLSIGVPAQVPKNKLHPNDYATSTLKGLYNLDDVDASAIEHFRRVYFSMCYESDTLLGQVLDQLEKSGASKTSYIIMISDHGEDNLEHRQLGKNNMYESGSRVALIVAGPRINPGQIVDTLASLNDIFPTVLDMAQIAIPNDVAGSSVLPLIQSNATVRANAQPRKDYVIAQYHSVFSVTGTFMVRQGDYKLIVFASNQFDADFPPQLFDLSQDPWELNDVATENSDVVQRLQGLISAEMNITAIDTDAKTTQKALFRTYALQTNASSCWSVFKNLYGETFNASDGVKAAKWLGISCQSDL